MPAKENWDGKRLVVLGAVVLGNSLSVLCQVGAEGLFYRVASRFPSHWNAWVTGTARVPAPGEGSSVVTRAHSSTSSASSVCIPPHLKFSCCSLLSAAGPRMPPPTRVPTFCYRGGVLRDHHNFWYCRNSVFRKICYGKGFKIGFGNILSVTCPVGRLF